MRYSGSSPRLPSLLQDILLPATAGISDEWLVELDMQEDRDGLKIGKANEELERATKGATSARHCLATGSVISTMAWGSGVATAFGPIRPSGRLTITRWVAEEAEGFAPNLLGPSPLAPNSPFVVMLELAVGGASRLASLELASRWRSPPLRSSTRRPALRVASSKLGHSSSSAECTGGFHFHWELSGAARSRRRCHRRNQTSLRSRPTPALLHTYLPSWSH